MENNMDHETEAMLIRIGVSEKITRNQLIEEAVRFPLVGTSTTKDIRKSLT